MERIQSAWNKRSLVWLAGVRRVGKTTLVKAIPAARYVNCDLPSWRRELEDPEQFFNSLDQPVVILDEVHRLPDPSLVLKIAADEYPKIRVLATGSSTLSASRKFRDSLTGRKYSVHLLPVFGDGMRGFRGARPKKAPAARRPAGDAAG